MGAIISRFKKKKSTLEILESLESELQSIESYSHQTERQHKRIVGHLLLFSVGAYIMFAVFFYFVFFPASLYDQLLYVVPLLLFPVIIVFLKRVISWWYRRKISRNQVKLLDIQKQKKQLLEEVMDKETYKVARQILEKYAPDQLRKGTTKPLTPAFGRSSSEGNNVGKVTSNVNSETLVTPVSLPAISSQSSQIRHRHVNIGPSSEVGVPPVSYQRLPLPRTSAGAHLSPSSAALLPSGTCAMEDSPCDKASAGNCVGGGSAKVAIAASRPIKADNDAKRAGDSEQIDDSSDFLPSVGGAVTESLKPEVARSKEHKSKKEGTPKGIPVNQSILPRPVLSENRSLLDRLVEYLVGDGVSQRYALICRECNRHNGMALKEEFEFLAFSCCYCFQWNPARKQRLPSPKLETVKPEKLDISGSSEESNHLSEEEDSQMMEVEEEEDEEEEEQHGEGKEKEDEERGTKEESQEEVSRSSLSSGSMEVGTPFSKSSSVLGEEKCKLRETGSGESCLFRETVSEKKDEDAVLGTLPEESVHK